MKYKYPLFVSDDTVENGYWLIAERKGVLRKIFGCSKAEMLSVAKKDKSRPLYFLRISRKYSEARLCA